MGMQRAAQVGRLFPYDEAKAKAKAREQFRRMKAKAKAKAKAQKLFCVERPHRQSHAWRPLRPAAARASSEELAGRDGGHQGVGEDPEGEPPDEGEPRQRDNRLRVLRGDIAYLRRWYRSRPAGSAKAPASRRPRVP